MKKITLSIIAAVSTCAMVGAIVINQQGNVFKPFVTNAVGCTHKHVEHHDGVNSSLLRSGSIEYWCCCDCHTSFANRDLTQVIDNTPYSPSDPDDGRFEAALAGTRFVATPANGAVEVSVSLPSDGLFDKAYVTNTKEGALTSIANNFNVASYERFAFAIYSNDVSFVDFIGWDSYLVSNKWYEYELVKDNEGKWDVFYCEDGSALKLRGKREGNDLRTIMEFGSNANTSYYLTNIYGILAEEPSGVVVDNCAIGANGATTTIDITQNIPAGYETVRVYDTGLADGGAMHGMLYSGKSLYNYSEVHFAIKSTGYYILNHSWDDHVCGPDTWLFFSLTQNSNKTWNLVVSLEDGSIYYTENNMSGFIGDNPGVYTNYALNAILYGIPSGIYPSKRNGVDLLVYATEVRGTKIEIAPYGTIINNSAISANGAQYTELIDAEKANGFEIVNEIGSGTIGSWMHGQYYASDSLENYSEAHFAIKTTGKWYIAGSEKDNYANKWLYFYVTVKGTAADLIIQDEDGTIVYQTTDYTFTGKGGVYSDYAINTLLFGYSLEVYPKVGNGEFKVYASELRGTKNGGDEPIEPAEKTYYSVVLDECAVSANGVTMSDSEMEAPDGYESVKEGQFTDNMHGKVFSAADLTDYQEVHFALKTDRDFNFDNSSTYSGHGWIFFTLTNNGNETFNLKAVDENGTTLCEASNLNGHRDDTSVYSNNALNAILYGNPGRGYSPCGSGTINVYVTELIGTLEAQNPTGSIIDECAVSSNEASVTETTLEVPNGFEKVNLWEGSGARHGKQYSAKPLTDYDDIHFAMKTDGSFNFNNEKSHSDMNWLFFNLKNNKDTTFNLTVSDVFGNLVYSMNSMASYKGADPGVYTNYALNAILYGIPAGIAPSGTNVYVTELRGTLCNELNIVSNSTTEYNIIYQPNNRYIINNDNQANQTAVKLLETNLKSAGSLSSISKVASSNEVFSDSVKSISIGDTSLLRTSGALNGETLNGGYLIKTVGNSVFVYAENPSDYIIAVNDLMEMMFGYKFYASTEIVLNHSSDIKMPRVDKVVNPSFKERNVILANGSMLATDDRSQLGYDSGYEWTINTPTHGMCGTFLNIANNESAHPNWYSRGNDKWGQAQYQLCYSAHGNTSEYEAMVSQTSSEIIQKVLNDYSYELTASNFPEIIIDLSIQDNWYECNCASCQAEKAKYGSFAGQQLHFVNDVANMTDEWFTSQMPNIKHSYKMLAYQQGQKAPTTINFSLNENIEIEFAPVYLDVTEPLAATGANAEHYADLCAWISLLTSKGLSAENMSLWLYSYSVNNIIPVYDYDAFQGTYKNMKDLGITKIRNQFQDGPQLTSFQDLNFYLKGLAMQDVNADLEEATKDFIDQYYGSGADKIYEYFTTMVNNMKTTYTDDNTVFNTHNDKKYWSKSVVQNLINLCDDAIKAVNSSSEDSARKEVLVDRINRERLTAVYMMLEFKYTTIFNKSTYKNFFSSTCSELGITHITATQTVSSWLSSK